MLRVIDRYVLLETCKVFAAIVVTLFLITASIFFLRSLEEVNVGALGIDFALRYLNYQLQRDSGYLMPPAFFLAALVALGRMARDSELIALHACGVGPVRMYRALLYLALPLALWTAWLALAVQPEAATKIQAIRKQQGEQATQIAGLQPGRFYQQADGAITFYAAHFDDGKRLREVFLYDRREDKPRLVLADAGYYRESEDGSERFIVLERGRRYDGAPGMADYGIGEFARYQLQLDPPSSVAQARGKRSTRRSLDLLASEDRGDRVELQHRLASPLALFSLALIAIPLTATSPRQTGTARMMLVLVTYFAFYNLQRLAENWFELGVTPDWLGSLWYQPLVVLLVFAILSPKAFWIERGRELRWVLEKAIPQR